MKTTAWIVVLAGWLMADTCMAFYNPETGRWLSRDPIGENGGENVYVFILNSSVGRVDSDGRQLAPIPCTTCGQPALPGHECVPPPPFEPYPVGFSLCRRDFERCGNEGFFEALVLGAGNALGGEHTYLQYVECELSPPEGWGFSGGDKRPHPDDERAFEPNSCKPCKRTKEPLQYGSGKGKKGADATDDEIAECIMDTPIRKDYSKFRYNCEDWAGEAAAACGLKCD